jgi:hypothetical protein
LFVCLFEALAFVAAGGSFLRLQTKKASQTQKDTPKAHTHTTHTQTQPC